MSQECDPGEKTQQQRSGTGNRFVRPLALGFHAQVAAGFFQGDFHLPALYKPANNIHSTLFWIGAKQGKRSIVPLRVADQNPADGHRRFPVVEPDRRLRGDIHLTLLSVVPGQAQAQPGGVRVLQTACQSGQSPPLLRGRPRPL